VVGGCARRAGHAGTAWTGGAPGPRGDRGIQWRGAWQSDATYAVADAIERGGSAYVAIAGRSHLATASARFQRGIAAQERRSVLTYPDRAAATVRSCDKTTEHG